MNISVGIVGLPNVGKSTLFNSLTKLSVDAQNYPFCTIEPNKGIVPVSDERIDRLSEIVKTERKVPAVIEFVDIAGLVKGASKGEGLGNQFLANIREVAAIVHLIRDFKDDNVVHVDGGVDPHRDIKTIETELILKDIETLEKRLALFQKEVRTNKALSPINHWADGLMQHLSSGKLAINYPGVDINGLPKFRGELYLLTDKPFIYLFNSKDGKTNLDFDNLGVNKGSVIVLDVKLEQELSELNDDERVEYIKELGFDKTGIEKLSQMCYEVLGLISFFTAGKMEVRAWTVKTGATARMAAGVIHTDFEKNFIAAEVISCDDFITCGGWVRAREMGKVRLEGRDYLVQEGDVMIFRHN